MMAIFHGMSCLTFLEHTRLFGFSSIVSRGQEREMGALILLEAFVGKWCHIQRCVFIEVILGLVSSATQVIAITKTCPWNLKADSYNQHQGRSNRTCCHGFLLLSATAVTHHLLGHWECGSGMFDVGILLKSEPVLLGH